MRKVALLLVGIIFSCTGCLATNQSSYNYIPAVVTETGVLICKGTPKYDGQVYEFSDDRFQSGDEVTVILDDNGTPDITDDIIYNIVREAE